MTANKSFSVQFKEKKEIVIEHRERSHETFTNEPYYGGKNNLQKLICH